MGQVRALSSFDVGNRRIIHRGDILPDDDPAVIGRENLFGPIGGETPPARAPAAKKAAKATKKAAAPKAS